MIIGVLAVTNEPNKAEEGGKPKKDLIQRLTANNKSSEDKPRENSKKSASVYF